MTKRILIMFVMLATLFTTNAAFSSDKDIPARLQTEVIKLRNISFTKPIEETIKTIIDTDYSGKAFFTFDSKNNAIIVTATNVTIDKIKRFLNKFDVKGTPVALKVYVLSEAKKKEGSKDLPKSLFVKLEKLGIYSVKHLATAFITSKTGKSVFVTLKDPEHGTQFEISFFLMEEGERIGLYDFVVYKILKEKGNVYNKWKIIKSSYSISPDDPLVIGISGENKVDYIFAVAMTK